MRTAAWQNLDIAARKLTPFLFTLALVIINLIPLHLPGYAAISPNMVLMAVYYWALHRPSLMPAIAVFIIGLSQDFLSGVLNSILTSFCCHALYKVLQSTLQNIVILLAEIRFAGICVTAPADWIAPP